MAEQGPNQSPRIIAKDVRGRAKATRLARTDRKAALQVAKEIAHP